MEQATPGPKRNSGGLVRRIARVGWLRRLLLHPVVARPGYWFATGCGLLYGAVLGRFHLSRRGGVIVARSLPKWAFGRGGTTIGAVFLTSDNIIFDGNHHWTALIAAMKITKDKKTKFPMYQVGMDFTKLKELTKQYPEVTYEEGLRFLDYVKKRDEQV